MPQESKASTQLELKGAKEYSDSVAEAKRAVNVYRAQIKAATSELGKNATAQDKAKKSIDGLKKVQQEQQKILDAQKKRYDELVKQYGENSKQAQNMRIQIANTTAEMNRTHAAIQQMEEDLKGVGTAAEQTGTKLEESLMKNLAFNQAVEKFKTFANAIKGVFSSIQNMATGVVNSVKDIVVEVAGAQQDIVDLSDQSGLSITTLNKINAANRNGYPISVKDFAAGSTKLRELMADGAMFAAASKSNGNTAGEFYGLNRDLSGNMLSVEDTMWAILQQGQSVYQRGDRAQIAAFDKAFQQVFGGNAANFQTFFTNPQGFEDAVKFAEDNHMYLDEETTLRIADIQGNISLMKGAMDSIREKFVGLFTEQFTTMTQELAAFFVAINKYMVALGTDDTEDDQEALDEISAHLSGIVDAIYRAIMKAWGIIKQALEGIAKQTGPDGKTPTFAARVAQGLLYFADKLPGILEGIKSFLQTIADIAEKVARFMGIDTPRAKSEREQGWVDSWNQWRGSMTRDQAEELWDMYRSQEEMAFWGKGGEGYGSTIRQLNYANVLTQGDLMNGDAPVDAITNMFMQMFRDQYGKQGMSGVMQDLPDWMFEGDSVRAEHNQELVNGIATAMKTRLSGMNVYLNKDVIVGMVSDDVSARIGGSVAFVGGFGE